MRIQHNIAALNSHRQLGNNNNAIGKNLEKLSSGFRINRAGDDAAGLAISEKMRAQITGLETAQKNANDGISLIRTAEGSLTEVHSMLNRMVELAGQSANGTYQNAVDRENLQKEVVSLKEEIDRISQGTKFNGINLLDGSLGNGNAKDIRIEGENVNAQLVGAKKSSSAVTAPSSGAPDLTGAAQNDTLKLNVKYEENGATKSLEVSLTVGANGDLIGASGNNYGAGLTADKIAEALKGEVEKSELGQKFDVSSSLTFSSKDSGASSAKLVSIDGKQTVGSTATDVKYDVNTTAGADAYQKLSASGVKAYDGSNLEDATFTVNGKKFVVADSGTDVSALDKNITVLQSNGKGELSLDAARVISQQTGMNVTARKNDGSEAAAGDTVDHLKFETGKDTQGLTLQIGDTSDSFNKLTVSIDSMSTASLGLDKIDISSQEGAAKALDMIKQSINTVSSTRGSLGALENRLDHTINNLGVSAENMTAAESRIRDVDMAKEMMAYSKNNILIQSSQAMLAQANQLPQGVLQLLR